MDTAVTGFLDGPRITPGSEKCLCGAECDFPCWERIGIAPACQSCECPPFEDDEQPDCSYCRGTGLSPYTIRDVPCRHCAGQG